jgi:predicted nucleic acid-binding protein
MKRYVLDASALICFFEGRPGADKVQDLLSKAAETKLPLAMSVINWGEVVYSIWRARGEAVARQKALEIAQLPIALVDADLALTHRAATFKARFHLPYADCFAAALAAERKAVLVTTDPDFLHVARHVKLLLVGHQ